MQKNIIIAVLSIAVLVLGYLGYSYSFKTSNKASQEGTISITENIPKDSLLNDENLTPIPVVWQPRMKVAGFAHLNPLPQEPFYGMTPDSIEYYKVGKVTGGEYKDGNVLLMFVPPVEMGSVIVYRLIEKDGVYVLVGRNSDIYQNELTPEIYSQLGLDSKKVHVDFTKMFKELVPPEKIMDPNTGQAFYKTGLPFFSPSYIEFKSDFLKKVFTDPIVGSVYTTPEDSASVAPMFHGNGFYASLPDGSTAYYALRPSFMTDFTSIPDIIWNDGSPNTNAYSYADVGGCGRSNYLSIVKPSDLVQTQLVVVGKTKNNETIYGLKDANTKLLESVLQVAKYLDPNTTYQNLVDKKALIFWKDPYGRFIKFQNESFSPQAECGKPVIYLYPEKETQVSVKVKPEGGFTFTEPLYNDGWNVLARPTGEIVNNVDGKTYPYLFWEGRGGMYQTPDKGWVITQKEVHSFLVEKLSKLGLNQKEIADFLEFWEPKMQGSPYYFVTFMGNQVMNTIAPLTISPAPNTIIRILMDFTPLKKPTKVESFNIKTPERKGFTVVEWGGVLR